MEWQAWYSLGVMVLVMVFMVATHLSADLVLLLGVFALLMPGLVHPSWMILDTDGALHGLGSDSVAVIGVLFIVAAGIRETGAVAWATERIFGRPRSTTCSGPPAGRARSSPAASLWERPRPCTRPSAPPGGSRPSSW